MRHIGNLPDAEQGRLFGDYLHGCGIPNQIEQDTDRSWMIWVAAEEQLDTARGLLDRFRRDPGAPEFRRGAADAVERRAAQEKDEEVYRRRFFTRRTACSKSVRAEARSPLRSASCPRS